MKIASSTSQVSSMIGEEEALDPPLPWWPKALLLVKVSKLVDVRIVSTDFRWTGTVRIILLAVFASLAMLLGLILMLLGAIGPAVISFLGPINQVVPVALRGFGLLFLIHHVLSISGQIARDVRSPADATILAHAGYTRWQVIVARLLFPISLETTVMATFLALCASLAICAWGVQITIVLPSLGLSMALTVSGALVRGSVLCILSTSSFSFTFIRSFCWIIMTFGLGFTLTGILVPTFLGIHNLHSIVQLILTKLESPQGTKSLILVSVILLLIAAGGGIRLRHAPWNELPVDSVPSQDYKNLHLPRNAWARLVVLPITAIRDQPDSEAGDFLFSIRAAFLTASFGLGALVAGSIEPIIPPQAAWGIAAGAPLISAGLAHGICSTNAIRSILPQLTASKLGDIGTASALVCSVLTICLVLGGTSIPLLLLVSTVTVESAVTAWMVGAMLTPGIMLIADCLFPALLPAESNGRIRQHPMASLLSAFMALVFGAVAYRFLEWGVASPLAVLASLIVTALSVFIVRFPRGTI